ncbi:hypothetical protein [Nocardioides sp. URHA0032]|uniref:hypothetical protein n=1 Tax=Nocardioides sp. URHA0032 TaxID=1380388 RepID=UPI000685DD7C|nr:hypothetical protein [Nocardioides sp. URHA0032]
MSAPTAPPSGRPVVISLCDLTGVFTTPWVDAGYDAILVDPQHGFSSSDGRVTKLAMTVEEALPDLGNVIRTGRVAFVAGWPPCTDLSGSGARWWVDKRAKDYMFQAKAVAVAEQCRTVGLLSGAPWFVENPVGALRRVFGPRDHVFDPCDFTALEPADNYTKETCLWTGGGFRMPPVQQNPELGTPDDRIHKAPPSAERANFRSATPMGFARAVFAANAAPILMEATA